VETAIAKPTLSETMIFRIIPLKEVPDGARTPWPSARPWRPGRRLARVRLGLRPGSFSPAWPHLAPPSAEAGDRTDGLPKARSVRGAIFASGKERAGAGRSGVTAAGTRGSGPVPGRGVCPPRSRINIDLSDHP
jgi:hypothetical protein